jgi:hypothetical protein
VTLFFRILITGVCIVQFLFKRLQLVPPFIRPIPEIYRESYRIHLPLYCWSDEKRHLVLLEAQEIQARGPVDFSMVRIRYFGTSLPRYDSRMVELKERNSYKRVQRKSLTRGVGVQFCRALRSPAARLIDLCSSLILKYIWA